MTDNDSLRDTIVPKSDQLNADDLVAGPITIKITGVKRGSPDQPITVDYEGANGRPYKPCKSMRRVMIALWGDKGTDWVGHSITLYCDPAVKFGGVAVGGIRISHATGIERDTDFMLTTTRSKRAKYMVRPLKVATYPDDKFNAEFDRMAAAIKADPSKIEAITAHLRKTAEPTPEQIGRLTAVAATSTPEPQQQDEF